MNMSEETSTAEVVRANDDAWKSASYDCSRQGVLDKVKTSEKVENSVKVISLHTKKPSTSHADHRSDLGMSVGDASTVSVLTMDEGLNTIGEQSAYTTLQTLSHAARKPVITARTSMQARVSDRSNELELNNLKLQNLPLCGRQKELDELFGALSKVQHGGKGLLLVEGVSGTTLPLRACSAKPARSSVTRMAIHWISIGRTPRS